MKQVLMFVFATSILFSTNAFAAKVMTVGEAKAYEKIVRAKGKRFKQLFCQQKGKSYFVEVERLARVYRNQEWTWAIGHSVSNKNLQLKKKGFKRAYLHTNEYMGRVQCAVWIK